MRDERVRDSIFPVRIYGAEGTFQNLEKLTEPTDLQIGLREEHLVSVKGKGYVILDFGVEMNGGVRILTHLIETGGTYVRIRTGESVAECCAEQGDRVAGNHHTLRDAKELLLNYSDMTFFETGFRFVRVDFLEDKEVGLKAIAAVSVHRDLHPVGSFTCSDERVNKIFEVASRTLMLNMENYIWDGIKRDRLVWIGDMHPETTGIACLFGSDPTVERSLSHVKDHTPLPKWMNDTPPYTAWWIIILHDYYMQNANRAYLEEQKEYLLGALELLDSVVSEEGKVLEGEDVLFDWPSHLSADERIGAYAIWTLAAKRGSALLRYLGEDDAVARRMLEKLSKRGAHAVERFKQCEAFLVYAGLKDAKDSFDFLTRNGAHGFSTFMSYYILRAIGACDPERALELMKEYYGAMLDLGATTFWEDFDLDWAEGSCPLDRLPKAGERDIHGDFGQHCYVGFRHSLCHGWSCGPIQFLMLVLGGIEILEPGCGKMRIKPVSAGLDWFEISYPTPHGVVSISYADGKAKVIVPEGVELVG